jgi:hypothetical protein
LSVRIVSRTWTVKGRSRNMPRIHVNRAAPPILPALIVACACQIAFAQRVGPPRPPIPLEILQPRIATGTAIIGGHVLDAVRGTPLRGVDIEARRGDGPNFQSTVTDGEGRFELRDLPAGAWSVNASKAGFITQQSGQRGPLQPARPTQIVDGQRYMLDFALVRGSAITGRISDDFGDPVAGAHVEVFRSRMVRGRRLATSMGVTDQTDDMGAFRLHSLPAGDYYIAAKLRAASPDEPGVTAVAGLPTYFPGTPSLSDGQRVSLGAGEERTGISFPVVSTRPVRVSGVVVNSSGTPAQDASVELLSAADMAVVGRPFGNFGLTQEGGRFTILSVPPGSYALTARVTRGAITETAFVPVSVGDDDMTGITVATNRGAIVSGSVVAIPGATLPPSLRIGISARSIRIPTEVKTAAVERGGTAFTLSELSGPTAFEVDAPTGWMLKGIELNGVEMTDLPIDFPTAGRMTGKITLTNRVTEISGTVMAGRATDMTVIVFPADTAKWSYPTRYVRTVRPDAGGRFRISALPPEAQYLAIAVESQDEDELKDPDVLGRMRSGATQFSLAEGEKKAIEFSAMGRQ